LKVDVDQTTLPCVTLKQEKNSYVTMMNLHFHMVGRNLDLTYLIAWGRNIGLRETLMQMDGMDRLITRKRIGTGFGP